MADDVDRATDEAELLLNIALSNKQTEPHKTGLCHNCHETVTATASYCDADCREDHMRRRVNA